MNNEFEFQVFEDSKTDCLKVFKSETMPIILEEEQEWYNAPTTKLIGKYWSEEKGTSIRTGLAEAVKAAQKKRTIIHVFFIIENNQILTALPTASTVSDVYVSSKTESTLYFFTCRACQRNFWFKLLEKTTLHHLILRLVFTLNYMNDKTIITDALIEECNDACQTYVYQSKYKFLALLSWYALYAVTIYLLFQHFTNR